MTDPVRLLRALRTAARWSFVALALFALVLLRGGAGGSALAQSPHKFKIYLSLSFSGDAWLSEAANIVKALAATPPYDKQVEIHEVISGMDPQK